MEESNDKEVRFDDKEVIIEKRGNRDAPQYEDLEVDDDFLEMKDKISLMNVIRNETCVNDIYKKFNEPMIKSICMWKYKNCVLKINKDDYFRETKDRKTNVYSILD
jgi:hypothetical protein